jgi:hypothetical protein
MPVTIPLSLLSFRRIRVLPKQRCTTLHRALNEPSRRAFRQQKPQIPKIIPTYIDAFASKKVVKTEQKSFFFTLTLPPTSEWLCFEESA